MDNGRITVRTTFRPDREIGMTTTEAEDLLRQGLLVPNDQEPPEQDQPSERPAPRAPKEKP